MRFVDHSDQLFGEFSADVEIVSRLLDAESRRHLSRAQRQDDYADESWRGTPSSPIHDSVMLGILGARVQGLPGELHENPSAACGELGNIASLLLPVAEDRLDEGDDLVKLGAGIACASLRRAVARTHSLPAQTSRLPPRASLNDVSPSRLPFSDN